MIALECVGGDARARSCKCRGEECGAGESLGELDAEVLGALRQTGRWGAGDRSVVAVAATVEVETAPTQLSEAEHRISTPESGGECVRDTGFATVPTRVPLSDAERKVRGRDRLFDGRKIVQVNGRKLWVRFE